jgi:hypothetical protein
VCRVEAQDALSAEQYHELMMDMIDEVVNGQLIVVREIEGEYVNSTSIQQRGQREIISSR